MGEPAYKASLVKSGIKGLRKYDADKAERILGRVDPEHLSTVERATRLDWVPAATLDDLNVASLDVLGERVYHDFWCFQTRALTELPLFGAMAKGAMTLFGIGPGSLLRVLDKAWLRTTRDYGRVTVEIDKEAGRARLSQVDLPACGRIRTVGLSMKASLSALVVMGRATGEVELDDSACQSQGRNDFFVTWESK